ncbi:uncharacterized protein LOC124788680 [Schistocerca piceifrons]|uniref:uncharacterized protein LOC124788680 n=1 Tax=Schistocerca piceifrons TaxID=274613 RepID=UPI001F5F729E|nr:uncharacterized protein LOC124788680 [Schistocerca piceifrons]
MKSKPGKYGIKIWDCADVKTSYLLQIQIYTGMVDNTREVNQGQRVVLDLMEPFLNSGKRLRRNSCQTEVHSSMLGFPNDLTLVSYVPKKRKAAILLSTQHNERRVSGEESEHQPEIILHYKKTKGVVDNGDKMTRE